MLTVLELKYSHVDECGVYSIEDENDTNGELTSCLPQEFLDCLPDTCDCCGSDLEITETLTMLRCSNPNCGDKSVQRLVTLLKDINVKNMGESKCRSFLDHFGTTNPYAIFMYEADVDGPLYEGCSQDFSDAIYEQINGARNMLLWEFVKYGNLPGIRDSARKLLSQYDDLEEFFSDIEAGGIALVQDLLSIKGKENPEGYSSSFDDDEDNSDVVSVKAVSVYNTLMQFKEEMLEAVKFVNIMKLDTGIINLCISTSVGAPFGSKKDFISRMKTEYSHKVHLNFMDSMSKDCQFLIWSKVGSPTSKVKKVIKYNSDRVEAYNKAILAGGEEGDLLSLNGDFTLSECLEYGLIPILTGVEFATYLDSL